MRIGSGVHLDPATVEILGPLTPPSPLPRFPPGGKRGRGEKGASGHVTQGAVRALTLPWACAPPGLGSGVRGFPCSPPFAGRCCPESIRGAPPALVGP